jgi:hypothetical protein
MKFSQNHGLNSWPSGRWKDQERKEHFTIWVIITYRVLSNKIYWVKHKYLVPEWKGCAGIGAVAGEVVESDGALGEGGLPAQAVGHRQGLHVTGCSRQIKVFPWLQTYRPYVPGTGLHRCFEILWVQFSWKCRQTFGETFLRRLPTRFQACGSVFLFSGSGSRVWCWRPIRIRIQGFNDQKLKKKLKFF